MRTIVAGLAMLFASLSFADEKMANDAVRYVKDCHAHAIKYGHYTKEETLDPFSKYITSVIRDTCLSEFLRQNPRIRDEATKITEGKRTSDSKSVKPK